MVRVLLVDDEPEVCKEFRVFLERNKFAVRACSNALEAIRAIRQEVPDVVLTDYRMPELTGLDLLHEVKLLAPEVPVILMSGDADMRTALEALRSDAVDFLRKPVDSKDLLSTLQAALLRGHRKDAPDEGPQPSEYGPLVHVLAGAGRDISLVQVQGPLCQRTAPRVGTAFQRMVDEKVLRRSVVVALKHVDYINNIGLNCLIDLDKTLRARGHIVALAHLSTKVRQYLEMLGYLKHFRVFAEVDEAVREIGP